MKFNSVKEIKTKYLSPRKGDVVVIDIDKVLDLYSDFDVDERDARHVIRLIQMISATCKDEEKATLEFCVDAKVRLSDIRSNFERIIL